MMTQVALGLVSGILGAVVWEWSVGRLRLQRTRAALRRLEAAAADLHAAVAATTGEISGRSERLEHLLRAADQRIARLAPGRDAPALAAAAAPSPLAAAATTVLPAGDLSHRHQRIYSLADRGLDAAAIARELTVPSGEVELILGLRKLI